MNTAYVTVLGCRDLFTFSYQMKGLRKFHRIKLFGMTLWEADQSVTVWAILVKDTKVPGLQVTSSQGLLSNHQFAKLACFASEIVSASTHL